MLLNMACANLMQVTCLNLVRHSYVVGLKGQRSLDLWRQTLWSRRLNPQVLPDKVVNPHDQLQLVELWLDGYDMVYFIVFEGFGHDVIYCFLVLYKSFVNFHFP